MALTTTLQKVEALYVAYYGRAGDPSGVIYWVGQLNNGKSFADLAGYFAVQTESKAAYPYLANPALVDPTSFVTQVYQNLFARAPDAVGLAYWVQALNDNQGNVAFVAQFMNYVIGGAAPADVAVLDNKVDSASFFTQVMATRGNSLLGPDGQLTALGAIEAKAVISNVTGDPASVVASKTYTDAIQTPGGTFHLTTATDHVIGTGGNDTIIAGALAPNGITPATTLNVLDTINGGGGVDTLVVDTTGHVNATVQGSIINVENLIVTGSGTTITPVNAAPFSGTITFQQTVQAALSVSGVTGQTLVLDRVDHGTVLTVALAATQDSVTLRSTGGVGSEAFHVAGAALKTINLSVDQSTSFMSQNVIDTGNTTETINIAASSAETLYLGSTALKHVVVTGAGKVSLGLTAGSANVDIDASGNTGGVSLIWNLDDAASFTGGTGNDTVGIQASTKAIALGAGDDTVECITAALGIGGTVDGGEGFDSFGMEAQNVAIATSTPELGKAFADTILNFEKLSMGFVGGPATVIDAQYLKGYTVFSSFSSAAPEDLTINNLATNVTFESEAAHLGDVTLNLKDATGAADVVNLKFVSQTGFASTGELTIAGVETINITTLDTHVATPDIYAANIVATSAKSIVITGNAGIDLTSGLATTTLTSLDASGLTATGALGGVRYLSSDLAAAASIKGGAGDDTLNLTAATKSVTVDGGGGDDVIGTGSGADIIVGGAGNDQIFSGTGLDIITGGAGNDIFSLSGNSNGNIYATITDASAGDVLNFADLGVETFGDVKITLADTAVFQDYLNAASVGDHSAAGSFGWFQFGGNTYVVEDRAAGDSFVNGTNIVVKLSGLLDLSTAVLGNHSLTLA